MECYKPHLESGEGSLVSAFALHLTLDGSQPGVAHLHVSAADVSRVLEVCRLSDHRPVNSPSLLPLSLSL